MTGSRRGEHRSILDNIRAHDRVSKTYERTHKEIYNPIEQSRIAEKLWQAVSLVTTTSRPIQALDVGCGAGNLTRHLLDLGAQVTASDVSPKCLDLVRSQFGSSGRCTAILLNGRDLSNLDSNAFDIVCTYSVLHHIPDYLRTIEEMTRVLRPGGVLVIDHEASPWYWDPSTVEREFKELVRAKKSPLRLLRVFLPSWHINRFRKLMNPRFSEEGDIHVWPDDHIQWNQIRMVVADKSCEVLVEEDYLLFRGHYPEAIWRAYRPKCRGDMRMMIARKLRR